VFREAFSGDDQVHLVVKVNNVQARPEGGEALERLRSDAAHLGPRVTLIEEVLPYREVLQLYASCDVFVSLHRAEGLGLGLMEAMALGKPVVATGWSGNMTFMNHSNSCAVGFRLVPVEGSLAVYSPAFLKQSVCWAEPVLDEAVAWMRALAHNATLRASIGRIAAQDMHRYRAEAERGTFLDELRSMWEHASLLPYTRAQKRETTLKALREAHLDYKASAVGKVLRRSRAFLDRHLLWRFRPRKLR
jgi:glycosyltransferase involved in cell wall biosynthesis